MADRLKLLHQYEGWANRRTLESIGKLEDPSECLRLFAHILAAQNVWLHRVKGKDSTRIEIFPTLTVERCGQELTQLESEFAAYFESLNGEDLDGEISYTTGLGKTFRNELRDILTHLSMHSHYHRGQIAYLVRQTGAKPAATDYIVFRREDQQ